MQNLIFTDELFLTGGWEDFPNQSMGVTEIEGVVEKDELRITDVSCMYWYKQKDNKNEDLFTFKIIIQLFVYFRIVWMFWDLMLAKKNVFTKLLPPLCIWVE